MSVPHQPTDGVQVEGLDAVGNPLSDSRGSVERGVLINVWQLDMKRAPLWTLTLSKFCQ